MARQSYPSRRSSAFQSKALRISAIVDAGFSVIADGVSR
jgi:hypothetical protein